jgi:hypothetical protein
MIPRSAQQSRDGNRVTRATGHAQGEEAMSGSLIRKTLAAIGIASIFAVSPASAQEAGKARARGTIEQVDGDAFAVKTRSGSDLKVRLTEKPTILAVTPSSLADIKPNTFVGITALPQLDGSLKATEVHVFAEALRGAGEGHYPWDLLPNSTMTNAAVTDQVKAVDGQTLTLKYKDGEKKITVPVDAPIVAVIPGEKGDIKSGAKIFIFSGTKQTDGSLEAMIMLVGRDGVTPPM